MRNKLVVFLALVAAVALVAGYAAQSWGADQVAPSTQPTTRPIARDDVAALFKPGRYKGAIVVPGMSARCARLHDILMRGMRENPEWFQAAVRAAPPGQPIAYDRRMGLTEEEYRNYLAWVKDPDSSDFRMEAGEAFEVEIVKTADGPYRFVGGPHLLSALSIDATGQTASTPCGSAGPGTITTTPRHLRTLGNTSPMLEWEESSGSLEGADYRSARLSVGVIERDGSLWLEYRGLRQGILSARNDRLILLIYINGAPPATQPK